MTEPPPAASPAEQTSFRPRLALGIAILAVSSASILIRFAQQEAPSLVIAALRISIASLVLAPIAIIKFRGELAALGRGELRLALLSGLFLAVHFGTWITSLEYTTVASSVVMVSTGPLWVALLSPLILKERISSEAWAGLVLALLGGVAVSLTSQCVWDQGFNCIRLEGTFRGSAMWGNFLALVGAWAVAGYLVIGRKLRAGMSLIPYIFLVYGMASIALVAFTVALREPLAGYSMRTYLLILLLALLPQLVGHSTYNWALRYLPASMVATANLGEPVGSALLAAFILQEKPGLFTILGATLILAGIYLASRQPPPLPKRIQP